MANTVMQYISFFKKKSMVEWLFSYDLQFSINLQLKTNPTKIMICNTGSNLNISLKVKTGSVWLEFPNFNFLKYFSYQLVFSYPSSMFREFIKMNVRNSNSSSFSKLYLENF